MNGQVFYPFNLQHKVCKMKPLYSKRNLFDKRIKSVISVFWLSNLKKEKAYKGYRCTFCTDTPNILLLNMVTRGIGANHSRAVV